MRIFTPFFHSASHALVQDFPSSPVLLNDAQDFDLPPALRLSPQQLEFIDPDPEPSDAFVRRHQPDTPRRPENPFSSHDRRQRNPHATLAPVSAQAENVEKEAQKNKPLFPEP